jgi:hypothetical protein
MQNPLDTDLAIWKTKISDDTVVKTKKVQFKAKGPD